MTRGLHARVDMRGFPWKLAMLERKLEHATAVQRLEAQKAAQTPRQRATGERIDAAVQVCLLRFLVQAEDRLADRNRDLSQLQERVATARRDCVDADRELARLRRLRESAEASYAAEQLRRQAKEADLAWLAFAARCPARPGPEEAA
jgi:flagellar biosynthesis chaperone FliJ